MEPNSTTTLTQILKEYWFLIVPVVISVGSFFALRAEFKMHKEYTEKRIDRLEDALKDDIKAIRNIVERLLERGSRE